MSEPKPALIATELDAAILNKLSLLERASLAGVAAIVAVNLSVSLFAPNDRMPLFGWPITSAECDVAATLSVLCLYLSASQRGKSALRIALSLAAILVLFCGAILAEHVLNISPGFDGALPPGSAVHVIFSARLSSQIAGGFALVGITAFFSQARRSAPVLIADLLVCGLILVALTLMSGQIIDTMQIFGASAGSAISAQATFCLFLLTIVAFARKTRNGFLSVFVGSGAGSKLARGLSPILLFLPYLRELIRARLINYRRMPPPYATALLASVAVIVAMSLLLYLAWRINFMAAEIHELSLRDELTGLYNLRGFRLLADQALRMARRSGSHFSVLFVDLDDLKQTNDLLGHQAGSECLMEIAQILRTTFREADVLGRIGGDEFAVAGEFSAAAIRLAAQRLDELAAHRNAAEGRKLALGFSVGHVTAEADEGESLDSLLSRADQAMYQEKRKKKVLVN